MYHWVETSLPSIRSTMMMHKEVANRTAWAPRMPACTVPTVSKYNKHLMV